MGGVLRGLGAAFAAVLTAACLTAVPLVAGAATTSRPTAVAVADDGTSYVGFAAGGWLARLSVSGAPLGQIPLDRAGPVTGLSVDPGDHVWVDYGDSVSELGPDGALLSHFAHSPAAECPTDRAHDPSRYGGIAVTSERVYVAGRCSGAVEVYSRGGQLRASIDLPGDALPRGIAWQQAQSGKPARLFVAVPDTGRVHAYDAGSLTSGSTPLRTIVVQRPAGGLDPVPMGVAADRFGQLVVSDVANNVLFIYDANNGYSMYRTLGHGPDPSPNPGYLDRPTAIAQHAQDGTDQAGNLWVADTGNGRIQRWGTPGDTFWAADVTAPGSPGAPTNTVLPTIAGLPVAGQQLTCSNGGWAGSPTGFAHQWERDGSPIAGAVAPTYVVSAADTYGELTCEVAATNAAGTSPASVSEPFSVPGPDSVPVNTARPVISGTPLVGELLTCGADEWTGVPGSYTRGWLRDGTLRPGTNSETYLVTRGDVTHAVTCRVAATNPRGTSTWAVSDPVDPIDEGGTIAPPLNTALPSISGTAEPGGVLLCDPGTWTNGPTYVFVWRVGETPMSNEETYTVKAADVGHPITCKVTGTNPAGAASATSAAIVVTEPDPDPSTRCLGTALVSVNHGARFTRKRKVTLRVLVPAGAASVQLSNDAVFSSPATRPLAGSCVYAWTLREGDGRAPKVVHVRFPGAADPEAVVSDGIVLDTTAPRVTRAAARWSNTRNAWVLRVRASDRVSGVRSLQYARARNQGAVTVAYPRTLVTPDSSSIQWVRVIDRAGNRGAWVRVRF